MHDAPVFTQKHYERLVARLRECLGPYVEAHEDLTPYVTQNRR